jgi:hypothetical protein
MYLAIRALIDQGRVEELELDPYPANHDQRRIADRVQDRRAAFTQHACDRLRHPASSTVFQSLVPFFVASCRVDLVAELADDVKRMAVL